MEAAQQEPGEIARAAAAGDEEAWRALVARFDHMLRAIVRGYRLAPADADDVVQTTWIRAYRNLDRLNEPAAVGAWLAITARREALRTLQRGVRELPAEEPQPLDEAAGETPEEIADGFPTLALADVYAVIGYYLQHRSEVDEYLRRRREVADEVRRQNEARFSPTGVRERLLARRRTDRESHE